jgi:2-amino-4-hydroxy-6-hydroxymethyldihydropteridine diphosphokinase
MTLPSDAVTAYIALGANTGERLAQLRQAVQDLGARPALDVTGTSPVYESEAHTLDPNETAPAFLNAVVRVRTALAPLDLLHVCQQIEAKVGRVREASVPRWAPRPLDLDILTVGGHTVDTPRLTIPHPHLGERRFVLQPWCDLAPNLHVPPPFDATVQQLLNRCSDDAALRRTLHALPSPSAPP